MPKDIVFVLDSSGSMAGKKLDQAKRALAFCLANLNEQDRFELIRFSTEAEPLFGRLMGADEEHRKQAHRFMQDLKPMGGTVIHDALAKALEVLDETEDDDSQARPRMVIFLTDGRPTVGITDEDAIVKMVEKRAGRIRVFCFGIGTDVNTHLLDKVTQTTRAASQYVLPEEDIEMKVSRFYTKIAQPVLANLKLEVHGDVRLSRLQPTDLPDLFHGEQLIVLGRYRGTGKAMVTLLGQADEQDLKFVEPFDFPQHDTEHAFIPRLWAVRRVGYLMDQIRLHGQKDELKEEVAALARAYGIVTPYTAYLIVEDESDRGVPLAHQSLGALSRENRLLERTEHFYFDYLQEKSGLSAVAGAMAQRRAQDAPMAEALSVNGVMGADGPSGAAAQTGQTVAPPTRYVAGRAFVQNGAQWVDTQVQQQPANAEPVRIAFGSNAYFELLRRHPEASAWLSVGRQVQVVIDGTIYEVVEES